MVWGSDWPHVNLDGREMPNDGDLLDLLLEWVPDAAVRNRILIAERQEALRIQVARLFRCENAQSGLMLDSRMTRPYSSYCLRMIAPKPSPQVTAG